MLAQTGNSCSNPYVMNLNGGAGNAEFQFHYPDTVMYVQITALQENQVISFQIDSLALLDIKNISIFNNSCLGHYIYDAGVYLNGKKNFVLSLSLKNAEDTILVVMNKAGFNLNCSGCDTSNLKLQISTSEQTLWMAQNSLVRLLSIDTTLLNTDDSLNYFYYSPDSRVLRNIDEIGRNNNAFEAQRNLFSHAILANDSLMSIIESQVTVLNSQMTDSLANDGALVIQRVALLAQYDYIKQMTDSLSNNLNLYHRSNLSEAADLNAELEPRNANEQILKTVNKIYFALRDNDYEYISNDDSTMLAYISHLCPLAAGHAVYKARDMYALLVDSVLYQDSAKCAMQGYVREEMQVFEPKSAIQKIATTYFKAFPVPSKNAVELQFSELNSEAQLSVYTIQGQLIYHTLIPKGALRLNLDIEHFSEGVYQVLLINNELSKRSKICKIK